MPHDVPQDPQVITTPDGSRTALNARFGEAYGSRHGADGQARHVFLEGSGTHVHPAPRVLEVGFGVGVNYRTTLASTAARGAVLEYHAFEFDPAPAAVLREVAAGGLATGGLATGGLAADHPAWVALLARWPDGAPPRDPLEFQAGNARTRVDFRDVLAADLPVGWATALYLDGFSPTRNPEVWTPAFVARLASALAPGGVLATYSAAGHVRRAMQDAGLVVERRPGATGKRECLRAVRPA